MKTDIVGVWSTYPLQGYGTMEDQSLMFRKDGTGWYDWSTMVVSNIKMFEWKVEEDNRLHLGITRRLRQVYNDKKWVDLEHTPELVVISFEITERQTPFMGLLPYLKIAFGFQVSGYSLINTEPDALQVPGLAL